MAVLAVVREVVADTERPEGTAVPTLLVAAVVEEVEERLLQVQVARSVSLRLETVAVRPVEPVAKAFYIIRVAQPILELAVLAQLRRPHPVLRAEALQAVRRL